MKKTYNMKNTSLKLPRKKKKLFKRWLLDVKGITLSFDSSHVNTKKALYSMYPLLNELHHNQTKKYEEI